MIGKLTTATALLLLWTGAGFAQQQGNASPADGTNGAQTAPSPNAPAQRQQMNGNVDMTTLKPSNMASIKLDDLKGADVLNPQGQKIASINDLVLQPDGKADAVIVDFGGFLGIGTKQIALAFEGLQFKDDPNGKHFLIVNANKDQLNAQKAYNKDDYASNRASERLVASNAAASSTTAGPTAAGSMDGAAFAAKAAPANMFEIQSSQLALKKAQAADVKTFAQKMIDDHTAAGKEMQTAAEAEKVTPPTKLDAADQATLDKLGGLSGDAFDKAYSAAQLKAHQDAVALFQDFASNGQPGPLKDFAGKTVPTLKTHLQMVEKLPK